MTWIRHSLIRWLAGRDTVAINVWFDPHNGVMISGLRDSLFHNVTVRGCRNGLTALGVWL